MPRGIYKRGKINRKPHKEETKKKLSLAHCGKKLSSETKEKIRIAKTGVKYPNRKRYSKGITPIEKICLFCKKPFITNCLMPNKKYCSLSCSKKNQPIRRGFKGSEKQKEMMRNRTGKLHPNWKGGISKINKSIRGMEEYLQWRSDVFTRDDWTCQDCKKNKCYVTAHHIKSFALILKENNIKSRKEARECEELWNMSNGKTLCEDCHELTDNYRGRGKKIVKNKT